MESLTAVLAFLVVLSLATERTTEVIKKVPWLSRLLFEKRKEGSNAELARQMAVQILSIIIGTAFASQVTDSIATLLKVPQVNFWMCLLFGALASGGSGLWNSALDIVREIKKQKEKLRTDSSAPSAVSGS